MTPNESKVRKAAALMVNHDSVSPAAKELLQPLPRKAHPTAKAFFDALDMHQKNDSKLKTQASNDNQHRPNNNQNKNIRAISTSLQKKLQSVGWRNRYSQDNYYPIEIMQYHFSVQQVQRGEIEGTYGTGATVWPAALVLMKYLEKHSSTLVKRRHVVDLGSGTGVTSIAAALLGASSVVCTDGEGSVVQLERDNIRHAANELHTQVDVEVTTSNTSSTTQESTQDSSDNDNSESTVAIISRCPIRVQKYWWGTDPPPEMPTEDHRCDLILVADCVLPKLYSIAPLVQAIDECLTQNIAEKATKESLPCAILSCEHRYYPHYDPRDRFRELATERNLHVRTIPLEQMDLVYSVEDIELWMVTRIQTTSR